MATPTPRQSRSLVTGTRLPFGWFRERVKDEQARALLELSHTPVEHRIYLAMLAELTEAGTRVGVFSVRRLMSSTRLGSYSTVRRGLTGLINKFSIEHQKVAGDHDRRGAVYVIFSPEEIFARRTAAGVHPYPREAQMERNGVVFGPAIERIVERHDLSRREAHVALCCAEGLTNAEIGDKLCISEQTVKFHLRHIFIKFKVHRRVELVSRLLAQFGDSWNGTDPREISASIQNGEHLI